MVNAGARSGYQHLGHFANQHIRFDISSNRQKHLSSRQYFRLVKCTRVDGWCHGLKRNGKPRFPNAGSEQHVDPSRERVEATRQIVVIVGRQLCWPIRAGERHETARK